MLCNCVVYYRYSSSQNPVLNKLSLNSGIRACYFILAIILHNKIEFRSLEHWITYQVTQALTSRRVFQSVGYDSEEPLLAQPPLRSRRRRAIVPGDDVIASAVIEIDANNFHHPDIFKRNIPQWNSDIKVITFSADRHHCAALVRDR